MPITRLRSEPVFSPCCARSPASQRILRRALGALKHLFGRRQVSWSVARLLGVEPNGFWGPSWRELTLHDRAALNVPRDPKALGPKGPGAGGLRPAPRAQPHTQSLGSLRRAGHQRCRTQGPGGTRGPPPDTHQEAQQAPPSTLPLFPSSRLATWGSWTSGRGRPCGAPPRPQLTAASTRDSGAAGRLRLGAPWAGSAWASSAAKGFLVSLKKIFNVYLLIRNRERA